MGVNPQEGLTKSDENRNVQNPVGGQVMQLESIGVQKATNKRMQWRSKPTREESLKAYPLIRRRSRNWLISQDSTSPPTTTPSATSALRSAAPKVDRSPSPDILADSAAE